MIRSRTLLALAALAVTAGLAGCGDEPANTRAKIAAPSVATGASPSASASLTPERLETIYVDTTAAHLCAVQSRVYTDPGAMADAYASKPIYAGLTDVQVEQYQQRIISDHEFASRLTQQIQQTCGTATK
ncbi:hypothetical protein ACFO1B_42285 [Dactylosporangium siamense]|uniref:DUF732 domain-containing protein n=1 Tax=Dactylosporangium siamense TaxID=685454 RepID=A0A919PVL5_9ACTN|nr:hypothetical protein [Dactylosporangium siamense]GIG51052.1 hypothetical protein Dsi01nite_090930 [Dactylosporangium siamense]